MRRTLLRIAISVLTFALGVGVSVGWQLYQWSLVPYEISPTCCDAVAVVETPRITRPSEITIERSQERDEEGRLTGETILVTSPRVMKLTIYGNSLCVKEAPSLDHLRLYESGAFHYSFKN